MTKTPTATTTAKDDNDNTSREHSGTASGILRDVFIGRQAILLNKQTSIVFIFLFGYTNLITHLFTVYSRILGRPIAIN